LEKLYYIAIFKIKITIIKILHTYCGGLCQMDMNLTRKS